MVDEIQKTPVSSHDNYSNLNYWEERYGGGVDNGEKTNDTADDDKDFEEFEWLGGWDDIKESVLSHCNVDHDRILHVGCGNSNLGIQLYHHSTTMNTAPPQKRCIVNTDLSSTVIEKMKNKYPLQLWEIADVLNLPISYKNSFHTIIDKGTLDALLCVNGLTAKNQVATDFMRECYHALVPGGTFILVTLGSPESRQGYIEKKSNVCWSSWSFEKVQCHQRSTFDGDSNCMYFVYVYVLIK